MTGPPRGCGAPAGPPPDVGSRPGQTLIEGRAVRAGAAAAPGYARLLNTDGEFAAEVPLGADGEFRFFAAPGTWTVRVLVPGGGAAATVVAGDGSVTAVDIRL